MLVEDTFIEKPILQNLVPVLTEDGVLRGLIQIPLHSWSGSSASLELPNRVLSLQAKLFIGEKTKRELMCAVFPTPLTQGREPWNGISNFLSADGMGYFSIWAIPVMNPDYNRVTIGELKLFTSNVLDPKDESDNPLPIHPNSSNDSDSNESMVTTAKVGVSLNRFKDRFSFIEFNWLDLFRNKLESLGIKEACFVSVEILETPKAFKALCYNSTDSSAVPYILQIMRISKENISIGSYNFVLKVEGKKQHLFHLILNIRS